MGIVWLKGTELYVFCLIFLDGQQPWVIGGLPNNLACEMKGFLSDNQHLELYPEPHHPSLFPPLWILKTQRFRLLIGRYNNWVFLDLQHLQHLEIALMNLVLFLQVWKMDSLSEWTGGLKLGELMHLFLYRTSIKKQGLQRLCRLFFFRAIPMAPKVKFSFFLPFSLLLVAIFLKKKKAYYIQPKASVASFDILVPSRYNWIIGLQK